MFGYICCFLIGCIRTGGTLTGESIIILQTITTCSIGILVEACGATIYSTRTITAVGNKASIWTLFTAIFLCAGNLFNVDFTPIHIFVDKIINHCTQTIVLSGFAVILNSICVRTGNALRTKIPIITCCAFSTHTIRRTLFTFTIVVVIHKSLHHTAFATLHFAFGWAINGVWLAMGAIRQFI